MKLKTVLLTGTVLGLAFAATTASAADTKHKKHSAPATASMPMQPMATQAQIDALNKPFFQMESDS